MSDPVLALVLVVSLSAAVAFVRFFKTLESDFAEVARAPLIGGISAGVLVRLVSPARPLTQALLTGIALTVVCFYSRLTGRETEPADGMLLGGFAGSIAALPLIVDGSSPCRDFAVCVAAGAVSGWGVTYAALHVANKGRQFLFDLVTAAAAVFAAWLPAPLTERNVDARQMAIITAALVPLIGIATVFQQWRAIRVELRHEASLGFLDDADVRKTAHPILRLGRGGWSDALAHREFVRIATHIALRKRRQRLRSDETARIYQLEIMKLRMQLQQMSQIDRAIREAGLPSDTMQRHEV